ncbi:dihydroorotate dehydrogenase [Planctomicrobium sp. SH661]|uniref:dihydroorotate dehydrogenase n=1 Tax=Planctomicrobium sp. SH661 TaxID=3448124 RepID=UPI003F5AFD74
MVNLQVQLNRLQLRNPILVASGTFGYAKEMSPFVDFSKIGGIIPKTITPLPRIGNPPQRTVETASGMLNSIGLDNDGIDTFIAKHIPYLLSLEAPAFANIAGRTIDDFATMARRLDEFEGLAGLELNISCPNVSGGVDFGTNPESARKVIEAVRSACRFPIVAKLTPNVTDITAIAQAAADGGADAVSLVNTYQGMAINWRKRKAILGNVLGGLSGPAIKPLALRCVYLVAKSVKIPIIGIGGISNIDDVMEFLVAGASAVQVGTANFFSPGLSARLVSELEQTLAGENIQSVTEIIGTLHGLPPRSC